MVDLDWANVTDDDEPEIDEDNQDEPTEDNNIFEIARRQMKMYINKEYTPRKIDLSTPKRYYVISIKGFKPEKIIYITELHNRILECKDDNVFIKLMTEVENQKIDMVHQYKQKVLARSIGKCDRLILSNKLFDCYDTLTGYTLIVSDFD